MDIDRSLFVSSAIGDAELVLGVVAPVGTRIDMVRDVIAERLELFEYRQREIRLSKQIRNFPVKTPLVEEPLGKRIKSYMDAGNEMREQFGRADVLALAAVRAIQLERRKDHVEGQEQIPSRRVAYFLNSLKHPEEVMTLREVYGPGFFLLGVSSPRAERLRYLHTEKGIERGEAEKLLERDESESLGHGQQTRKAFQLADAFVALGNEDNANKDQIWRILDLLFGQTFHTPTREEHAMFLAYATAMRSGDLSRQVGAVILSVDNDVIATGANDVPKCGGGQYWSEGYVDWPEQKPSEDKRDWVLGYDSNKKRTAEIVKDFSQRVVSLATQEFEALVERTCASMDPDEKARLTDAIIKWSPTDASLKAKLKGSLIMDLTEFGRPVHAEMEALLCCARVGVSPRRGRLFTTTFPCHNCTKHIVAAGISEVFYIEPYPKSLAQELHGDAVVVAPPQDTGETEGHVVYRPFSGIGPRRFIDLFSLVLGMGRAVDRKSDVADKGWRRKGAQLRCSVVPTSYLNREISAVSALQSAKEGPP